MEAIRSQVDRLVRAMGVLHGDVSPDAMQQLVLAAVFLRQVSDVPEDVAQGRPTWDDLVRQVSGPDFPSRSYTGRCTPGAVTMGNFALTWTTRRSSGSCPLAAGRRSRHCGTSLLSWTRRAGHARWRTCTSSAWRGSRKTGRAVSTTRLAMSYGRWCGSWRRSPAMKSTIRRAVRPDS